MEAEDESEGGSTVEAARKTTTILQSRNIPRIILLRSLMVVLVPEIEGGDMDILATVGSSNSIKTNSSISLHRRRGWTTEVITTR